MACYVPLVELISLLRDKDHGYLDPARAVRVGLAKALVHYYPMTGCLWEVSGSKLMVDCAAQGAVVIDATTDDVRLEDLGEPLVPPYPCAAELFCKRRVEGQYSRR
uniref:Uncharacterized protein n=1 Tax=Leersia perrieri TaxID=77586 RepID=A0A0D9WXB8_9ORYZ